MIEPFCRVTDPEFAGDTPDVEAGDLPESKKESFLEPNFSGEFLFSGNRKLSGIDQFGILRGLVLATWRIARCQPFGGQGLDRVEDQTIFPLSARLKRAPK